MYKLLRKFSITVLVVVSVFASSAFVSSSNVFAVESNFVQGHQASTIASESSSHLPPSGPIHTVRIVSSEPGPASIYFIGPIGMQWFKGTLYKYSQQFDPEGSYYITYYTGVVIKY